jgi:hypothetical protein
VDFGSVDHQLAKLVNILLGDRFGVRELFGKDGWNTNLVGLDIDVGRDDGSRRIVDTFSLPLSQLTCA